MNIFTRSELETRQQCDEVQNKEEPSPAALHIETEPDVFPILTNTVHSAGGQ